MESIVDLGADVDDASYSLPCDRPCLNFLIPNL